jgi:metallophosphoesterase (TIGR00282 family)
MKIFFIGDIVGRPGRNAVREFLPKVIKEYKPDLVIANVENLSHGKGSTQKNINEMKELGVGVFTGGNHSFDIEEAYETEDFLMRPANFPDASIGKGYVLKDKVLVINLIGRTFMNVVADCPFRKVEEILIEHAEDDIEAVIVDFHAEATSEKYTMKHFLDGKVAAVFGTHTHIPTCDWDVTESGTFYVSDVGMTGIMKNTTLGIEKEVVLSRFLRGMPVKHEIEKSGEKVLQGFLLDIFDKKVHNFTRLEFTL